MSLPVDNVVQSRINAILTGKEVIELLLFTENGLQVGVMRPLTTIHLKNNVVIRKLTDWRNKNMNCFLTHFQATEERTLSWIENIILKKPGQMLWLIYDRENTLIGHFGFKDLTNKSVLLDNAIRGERHGHPKLFVFAGRSLVQWLWDNTSVTQVDGVVMADNVPAIMMNREIGFQGWECHPLVKREIRSEVSWDMGENQEGSPDERYCFKIFIKRYVNICTPN